MKKSGIAKGAAVFGAILAGAGWAASKVFGKAETEAEEAKLLEENNNTSETTEETSETETEETAE